MKEARPEKSSSGSHPEREEKHSIGFVGGTGSTKSSEKKRGISCGSGCSTAVISSWKDLEGLLG